MKFRVEREILSEALGDVSRVASTRNNAMPALSGVELQLHGDALTLACTDKELSLQITLEVGGQKDGTCVVNAKLLSDVVRGLPEGKVTFTVSNDIVTVEAGRSKTSVPTYAAADFPKILTASAADGSIAASVFGEALRQVVRAASDDMQRLALTGVLVSSQAEGLTFVATDSYRLAVRSVPGSSLTGESRIIAPKRALDELRRLIKTHDTITYRLSPERATFIIGNATLSTTLLDVEFPNYKQLIQPSYPNKLSVNREQLLDAVRRAKVFARETTPVRLEMTADSLKLSVVTNEIGETIEVLDATLDGAPMTIGFNPDYLAAGIDAVAGEQLMIETTDPVKPAVLRGPDSPGYLYLVMPQRLTQ